ncbi:hypothetical protein PIB30_089124 [Stylosanthes scabra]|uniref:Uncharacterized protein n=1 Tax=Stylosanthes scabra TaxID=79078 RepID=A0ABU6QUY3_9FABA|nr:hypothetical protein [Stylosanthes scabra]
MYKPKHYKKKKSLQPFFLLTTPVSPSSPSLRFCLFHQPLQTLNSPSFCRLLPAASLTFVTLFLSLSHSLSLSHPLSCSVPQQPLRPLTTGALLLALSLSASAVRHPMSRCNRESQNPSLSSLPHPSYSPFISFCQ